MEILIAFLLTLVAGLSTGVGGIIALLAGHKSRMFLALSLSFSAGVMIYVSLVEILWKSRTSCAEAVGEEAGYWLAILAFFGGIALIALVDHFLPEGELMEETKEEGGLMRMGLFTAWAIAIHNFPEGLATFVSAIESPLLALPVVVAIAIHNVPEGLAVAVPIYRATGSRRRAFLYSLASGLAEPVGALLGWLILMPFMSPVLFGMVYGGVAGIMVFISFDELLPSAREYGPHKVSLWGLLGGMAVMALSLVLL